GACSARPTPRAPAPTGWPAAAARVPEPAARAPCPASDLRTAPGRRPVTWDYGSLASEVYELDKPIGHSFGDVEYYTGALTGTEGPVLEPAVGTGRMLIPLLQAGLQVEGFDVSPHMLAICRGHCAERGLDPVLSEADMTTFTSPGRYAALSALGCFRDSLRPGGRLIVDVDARGPMTGPVQAPVRHWRRHPFLW